MSKDKAEIRRRCKALSSYGSGGYEALFLRLVVVARRKTHLARLNIRDTVYADHAEIVSEAIKRWIECRRSADYRLNLTQSSKEVDQIVFTQISSAIDSMVKNERVAVYSKPSIQSLESSNLDKTRSAEYNHLFHELFEDQLISIIESNLGSIAAKYATSVLKDGGLSRSEISLSIGATQGQVRSARSRIGHFLVHNPNVLDIDLDVGTDYEATKPGSDHEPVDILKPIALDRSGGKS